MSSLHKINKERKKSSAGTSDNSSDKSKLSQSQSAIKRKDSIIGIIFGGGKKTKSLQNVMIQSNENRKGSVGSISSSRVHKQTSENTMNRRESVKNVITIPEKGNLFFFFFFFSFLLFKNRIYR